MHKITFLNPKKLESHKCIQVFKKGNTKNKITIGLLKLLLNKNILSHFQINYILTNNQYRFIHKIISCNCKIYLLRYI